MEKDLNDASTFFFTPDISDIEGGEVLFQIDWLKYGTDDGNDRVYYGGATNYLAGTGTNALLKYDWRNTAYQMGYISAWTDNLNCMSIGEE